MNFPEILALIPARGGSKGIPKKNLVQLCGKPLIQYTIDAAKKSKLINRIVLSSDDTEIMEYCRSQIEIHFKRPAALAKDDTPMLPVVKHAVEFLEESENYRPDYIILLQPTSPLRTERHIDEALGLLINSDADSIVSVVEVPHNYNPYSIMELDGMYLGHYLKTDENLNLRQKKPRFYARNGAAIYAFTYNCLMKKNSLYGDKILPYLMKKEESVDIDDMIDLLIAECLLLRRTG